MPEKVFAALLDANDAINPSEHVDGGLDPRLFGGGSILD